MLRTGKCAVRPSRAPLPLAARASSDATVSAAAGTSACLGFSGEEAAARFSLPEINLGLMPGFGGSCRFAKLAGTGRAMEAMLTGKQFTAIEAKEMGVVNQVVQKGKALETSLNLAEQIQSKSALSIAAIMTTVNDPECISMEEKLKKEAKAFGSLFPTHDAQEGMKAFLEKRLPEFKDK